MIRGNSTGLLSGRDEYLGPEDVLTDRYKSDPEDVLTDRYKSDRGRASSPLG